MKRVVKEILTVCAAAGVGVGGGLFVVAPSGGGDRAAKATEKSAKSSSRPSRARAVANGHERFLDGKISAEFVAWLREASEEELRAMVLERVNDNTSDGGNFQVAVVLRKLMQENPGESFEFFRKEGAGNRKLIRALFSSWSSLDPHAATEQIVTRIQETRSGSHGGELLICFRALARVDLDAALNLVEQLSGDGRESGLQSIMIGHATAAGEKIPEILARLGKEGLSPGDGLTAWASVDPDAAIAWLRQANLNRSNEVCLLASGLGATDPRRAVEIYYEFNGLKDGPNYRGVIASTIAGWMAKDYETALKWIESKGTESRRDEVLKRAFWYLVNTKPEFAIEKLLGGDETATRFGNLDLMISSLSRTWSEDEMLALLDQAPGEMRPRVRDALMGAGYLEPTSEFVSGIVGGDGPMRLTGSLRRQLIRDAGALEELVEQTPPERRGELIKQAGQILAERHPEALLEAMERLDDPKLCETEEAQLAIAHLTRDQPRGAIEMVEGLPVGTAREYGTRTVVANLMIDDPESALVWLNSQREALGGEATWEIASRLRSRHEGKRDRIDELFGDLEPEAKEGAGGAEGGASLGSGVSGTGDPFGE